MELKKGYKQTEMGVIPEDWEINTLGDVARVIGGGTPSSFVKGYWNGNIEWFTPTEIGIHKYVYESERKITLDGLKNSSARLLPKGAILLTTRAGIGDISILMTEAATNQGFQSIVANEGVYSEYLYYLISTLKGELLKNASGSTFLEISPGKLKSIKCIIPSLKEQTTIANALSDADALIQSTEKLIAKKRLVKQAAMQQLLTSKADWEIVALGDICYITKLAGFEYSKYFNSYQDGGDIIVVRGTNITNNRMNLTDVKTIPRKTSAFLQRSKLNKGDLVFAYVGTIGPVFIIDEDDKYHLGPNTAKISVEDGICNEYIYHYFTSSLINKQISEYVSVGAQPSLSMNKIRKFKIAIPSLIEQTHIANILSDMDTEITALEAKLQKYRHIKQGMMQNLLTGKIRLV